MMVIYSGVVAGETKEMDRFWIYFGKRDNRTYRIEQTGGWCYFLDGDI